MNATSVVFDLALDEIDLAEGSLAQQFPQVVLLFEFGVGMLGCGHCINYNSKMN